MKKFLTVLILMFVVFAAYSQVGIIREMTGEVEIKHAGAASFTAAFSGTQLAQDTIVSTGFRSTVIIEVGSNMITVRPLTRLTLAEITSAAGIESLNVNLDTGRVRVDVRPPAGTRVNTSVQSPSATASVRGTSFEMDVSNVTVTEGRVAWAGKDGLAVSVFGGSSSSVSSDGSAQSPVEAAAADLMPPAPVGSGAAGEPAAGTASSADFDSGSFDINLNWKDPFDN